VECGREDGELFIAQMPTHGPGARVEVFLDHSNFYNGLKDQFQDGSYDFLRLVREVTRGRKLVRWNFYCGKVSEQLEPDKARGQSGFHRHMENVAEQQSIPLKMCLRPLMYPPGYPKTGRKPAEKGIDALIVQDMIVGAFDNRFDVAVLLSGDRDFCNVVEFLKTRFPQLWTETLFPNSRRHLFDMVQKFFDEGRVLDKHLFWRIERKQNERL
jgi:uncharacterized LabA/DUF88 family protein